MAALRCGLSVFSNFLSKTSSIAACEFQQVRNNYFGRWMRRDVKRRKMAEEHSMMRVRLVALKRNTIFPPEIHEVAQKMIDEKIPRQTALRQLTYRCVFTSRGRGVVPGWRFSRIVFRDLADYNKLSGVQRAMW